MGGCRVCFGWSCGGELALAGAVSGVGSGGWGCLQSRSVLFRWLWVVVWWAVGSDGGVVARRIGFGWDDVGLADSEFGGLGLGSGLGFQAPGVLAGDCFGVVLV
ncbi:unnamed protein product [Rhodiola kirilowii]